MPMHNSSAGEREMTSYAGRSASPEGVRVGRRLDTVEPPAPRLGQPPQEPGEQKTGECRHEKCELPALQPERCRATGMQVVPPVRGYAAEDRRAPEAERDGSRDHRRSKAAARLGIVVEGERDARRLCGAFADTDPEARQGEQPKAMRCGGERGRDRPECDRDAEQPRPYPAVGEPPEWQREQRVEERKHRAVQQPHFGITDADVVLDAGTEDREDVAIEQAHRVGERDQRQRIAGRVWEARAAHRANQRSALVCISFFLVASGMSRSS